MFKKIIFKNGLRLVLAPLKETKTITLLVLFGVGSRYENKKINGISHFIEHMMFKGTKKRPNTLALSKELDKVGAEYNAFTAKDHTGYYIKINYKHVDLAFDILSDMLFNSKFDPEELEKEKGVIIEEINMYEDNPMIYIDHLFEEIVYQGNSLGWQISGTRESVSTLNREELVNYLNRFYEPKNTVIGVAGSFGREIVKLVEQHFVEHTNTNKMQIYLNKMQARFDKFVSKQTGPQINLRFKETEQVQLALGFSGYPYTDPRIYALSLLAIILGGNMSSRLFIRVRERLGLAYHIRAGLNIYQDTGNFVIEAGLDKARINEAIRVILEELKKVKEEGVTSEELKRAKDFLDGKMTIELEDSSNVVEWYTKQELLIRKILTPEEKLKKFFAVTKAQVKKVAYDIIKEGKLNLALIGPFKEENRFLKLLKI